MDVLEWIQDWFKDNCDGDWERSGAIQITSSDSPGWEVEIDISNTSIANLTIDTVLNENGKDDWYGVKIEHQMFSAMGDSGKLIFLLGMFRKMIEKIES